MPYVFAIALFLHGVAHLVGFLVPWKLIKSKEMPYKTTIFSDKMDLGDAGIRLFGLLWLVMGLSFMFLAWACWTGQDWVVPGILVASLMSFGACILGWPQSGIGIWVNMAIIIVVVALQTLIEFARSLF